MAITRFLVRYSRSEPAPREHLMDISEQFQALIDADPLILEHDAGPAVAVDFADSVLEVLFSVEADTLEGARVKAAEVQSALIDALASADAEQTVGASMELCAIA